MRPCRPAATPASPRSARPRRPPSPPPWACPTPARCWPAWPAAAAPSRPGCPPSATPVAYGWLSFGQEGVGELERAFRLPPGEAYVWDCATLPAYRGRHLYSALLTHLLAALAAEGVRRVWIGASLENRPSIRGFQRAGFQPALRLRYTRLAGLHGLWVSPLDGAAPALFAAARTVILTGREWRVGPLVLGLAGRPHAR